MEDLKAFVRTRGAEYLKNPNISSVGIGYKRTGGIPTKDISIQFTVREKAVAERLEALGTPEIPKSFSIGGVQVPTDVIERDFKVEYRLVTGAAGGSRKKRLDPINRAPRGRRRNYE